MALDLSPQTKVVWALLPQVRFCVVVVPENVGNQRLAGAETEALPPSSRPLLGPGTLLAGLPILSFLEHILTNVPLLYKGLEKNVILTSVFCGGRGREGTAEIRSRSITMLLILILDVKLQMLIINKIYIQS